MTTVVKPRRLGRIVLVLSLALNVLLAGAIIGALASGKGGTPRSYDLQIGPFAQVLSQEQRRALGRDLRRAIRESGLRRPQQRGAMTELVTLLESETFDPVAFEDIVRSEQTRLNEMRGLAVTVLGAYLSDLPQSERAAIAEGLQEQASRGGGDRKGLKPGEGRPN